MIRRLVAADPRIQAALAAGLILVILLACWWEAAQWYRERLVADERTQALAHVNSIGTALTKAIDRRIDALDGLAAFVQSDPSEAALAEHFDTFASALYPTADGIRSFRIYVGGINRLVYPREGNESTLGLNIFEHPSPLVREAVQRTLQTGRTALIGPYELGLGGSGLMASRPIFVGDDFWGFAVILVAVPPLLQDVGLDVDPDSHPSGLSLALEDSLGDVFYGAPGVFKDDPVTYKIELPEGAWELAGVPVGGWDAAVRRRPGFIFESAGLVIVGLLTSLTYLTTNRQAQLTLAVSERASEIAQINSTLERQAALLELAHDAILVRSLDGVISFWNLGAERLYGWSRAEALGAVSHDVLQTVFPGSREAVDAAILRDGRWDGELIHTRRNGERIYVSSRHALQRDEQDRPLGVMEINIDITERKQAEEALERRVAERTRELSALLDLSRTAGSTLELRPLLGLILDQLKTVVEYTGAAIFSLPEGGEATVIEYRGPLPRDAVGHGRSHIKVPLTIRGMGIGVLTLTHRTPGFYTQQNTELAMVFGQHAAAAIENARLYAAARDGAALEERQRLARELHDSVSQVLYSIGLITSSAEAVLKTAPERLPGLLGEVLALAGGGLAEMRALIFELRPESLEQEGLVAALEKQAAAVQARHAITVRADLADEPELPIATKEALYRIAQEALQNAVKHARPRTIDLVLEEAAGELRLCVADDGIGFDSAGDFPGHLGLHTMRERADGIGGVVELDSAPGRGTRVLTRLPLPARP